MPSASVTANPKIRLVNWPGAAAGLRIAAHEIEADPRVADRGGQEVAEDVGHADGRATHADGCDTGADELCSFRFHFLNSLRWCFG